MVWAAVVVDRGIYCTDWLVSRAFGGPNSPICVILSYRGKFILHLLDNDKFSGFFKRSHTTVSHHTNDVRSVIRCFAMYFATYVLVHGGWHGGWCWKRVTPYLRDSGHTVYTPTLTGLGERSHLASPEINLSTHIQDILNVLIYEDLTDVVLVGHSYSGMVIAGVADRAPERVTRLVYLDAFVPEDGQSLRDILRPPHGEGVNLESLLVDGWRLPYPFLERPFGITSEVDKQWVLDKITPQPANTLLEPSPFYERRRAHDPANLHISQVSGRATCGY
jgi:pimeloyl-ACP methyl ester carboxylesterase